MHKSIPIIKTLSVPAFHVPQHIVFNNGIDVYGFPGTFHDITRVDIVLDSGRWTEKNPLIAHSVAKLFKSGTSQKSAFKMSEEIDHLGSTISVYAGYHGFNISIYAMRKNLYKTLELMYECLTDNIFPESEWDNYIKNSLAKQAIHEEKTEFIAERKFRNLIFGDTHPYGYASEERFLKNLSRADIIEYYQNEVQEKKPTIFISGTFEETDIDFIRQLFENTSYALEEKIIYNSEKIAHPLIHKIEKNNTSQSSLAIGQASINKLHPEFALLSITNTIFGGYFGSRLMSNIREDKGYTYGIYSSLQTYRHDGTIMIQTETSPEHVEACIHEIQSEIQQLQQDFIDDEELKQARNYLLGKYLSRMDGAFAQMETFKNYIIEGVDIKYFNNFADIIASVTKEQIRDIAQKHYHFENMYQVVAGK